VIEGRVVVGYLRLASPAHAADLGGEIDELVARLRELVLPRLDRAALATIDDRSAAPDALAGVAHAIEEAGRRDPTFAREVTRLCDELARRAAQPVLMCSRCGHPTRPEQAFCDHCGVFLEWSSVLTPPTRGEPPPAPAPSSPAPPAAPSSPPPPVADPEHVVSVPTALEVSGTSGSSRQLAQTVIDHALSTYVQRGRLLFNPPEQMRQGRAERVKVAIAQRSGLDEQLRALAPDLEDAAIEDLETTPFMEVDLHGAAFSIVSLQAGDTAEQLLRPTALWQFDVTPERGGTHPLQLRVAMRIPLPDRDERVSLPVLERTIRVRVDAAYGGRRFVRAHWQWVVATLAGLGGAVGAWIKLFSG